MLSAYNEPVQKRRARPTGPDATRTVRTLLLEEALTTWVAPTFAGILLAGAMLLDALGAVSERVAALAAVVALLILGAASALGPKLRDRHQHLTPRAMYAIGMSWIVALSTPFALRLFPGPPVATIALASEQAGSVLPVGTGRFDLVVDAHLPLSSEHASRQLHYDVTFVDAEGRPMRYDGELGDRWQTRRLGRRGTAPMHLEHLSTSHEIDVAGGTLRLEQVTLTGVPHATLAASIYRHRIPSTPWLSLGGIVLALGALLFDFWWDPQQTPAAALLTATAAGAVVIFCSSAAGHPGLRQVFGSMIVGGIGGVPTAGIATWLARRSPWVRAIPSRHTR